MLKPHNDFAGFHSTCKMRGAGWRSTSLRKPTIVLWAWA